VAPAADVRAGYAKKQAKRQEMNRFFTDSPLIGGRLEITGGAAHHIRNVLRLREGEKIICVKNKKEFVCDIDKFKKNSIIVLALEEIAAPGRENGFGLALMQGIPKGGKLEFIVEKAAEAGATEIIPLKLSRCVAKIDGADIPKKLARYNKIALSAAEQSGRLVVPEVAAPKSLGEIRYGLYDLKILCYEDERRATLKDALSGCAGPANIAVAIGPEGGIAPEEASYLEGKGFVPVSLGGRVLRCETAGLYAVACINYHYGK
jgi:16S rRNA (uracil1498-N3)-methyltransferase